MLVCLLEGGLEGVGELVSVAISRCWCFRLRFEAETRTLFSFRRQVVAALMPPQRVSKVWGSPSFSIQSAVGSSWTHGSSWTWISLFGRSDQIYSAILTGKQRGRLL